MTNVTIPQAEYEQLLKDAERFKYILNRPDEFCITQNIGHDWIVLSKANASAAIDKAMEQT